MAQNNPEPESPPFGGSATFASARLRLSTIACALAGTIALAALVGTGAAAGAELPAPVGVEPIELRKLATVEQPIDLATRPGDPRVYVAERTGRVRVIAPGGLVSEPYLATCPPG